VLRRRLEVSVEIRQEPGGDFRAYAEVPISFRVQRVLVLDSDCAASELREEIHPSPFTKDYDGEPGHHPTEWPTRLDTSEWIVIAARRDDARVGGTVVIIGDERIDMTGGRPDQAVIWDIRVRPEERGRGTGGLLLGAAEQMASARGCSRIQVETQNINVGACRFYERHGYRITEIDTQAYPELPAETQLIWCKDV